MAQIYSKEFKEDCVLYVQNHPELSIAACARTLGINENSLHSWLKRAREGGELHRGAGNYASEEAKELARVKT